MLFFVKPRHESATSIHMSPLFWDPADYRPSGFSVHGILQARMLEWFAISVSRGSSWPRNWTHVSCIVRWIIYHWATWEILSCYKKGSFFSTHCFLFYLLHIFIFKDSAWRTFQRLKLLIITEEAYKQEYTGNLDKMISQQQQLQQWFPSPCYNS